MFVFKNIQPLGESVHLLEGQIPYFLNYFVFLSFSWMPNLNQLLWKWICLLFVLLLFSSYLFQNLKPSTMVRICNNTYLGGRLREEDHEFEACLSNTVRLCLKKFKKKKEE
jgi:hypothetical protein